MKRFLMIVLTLLAAAPLAAQADLTFANAKSTPSHLHFAVNDNGVWENPRAYLP